MQKSNFDKLIDRYLTGKVTEQERKKIEAWLQVMKAERDTDLELSAETEERLFQKITSPREDVKEVVALYPVKSWIHQALTKQWVRVAASVVVILSISFSVWTVVDTNEPVNRVAAADKEKLILNDGTLVWLQPGSKFTYYQTENTRQAKLTGEAFFEVAKIPNSTFTITCGSISVKVLGTSFNLKTNDKEVELKVLTGKVNLSSATDDSGISVTSNERVVYTREGETERSALRGNEVTEITSGTEYDMLFDNITMDKVIERIAKKFDVNITVTNKQVLECHVKVDLTDNSLENTLTTLTHVLDVSYRIDKKKVEISGKGCD